MRFTINDKHLIEWMWVKKYVEKRLFKMFLTEEKSWRGKDTDQNISARSLTLLIFAEGWAYGICPACDGQLEHESMMPLLSLSPLNVLTH